ncbi:MAG: cation-transporting P-type ATPase [Candidatus Abyssobacteria bacterium SURF_5]|uniref:Cation-transporting P-type ATPase n=1 Tax=Abyssobacteria bacterium (strain SURF_5) TaxID=2093360 RepID=A0A3A4NLJ5_ABYX5|nr:MAG: cation-transporting P-type ATPase [Candidatus Abyssubacteria bacterium SURF_5]
MQKKLVDQKPAPPVRDAWARPVEEILRELEVDPLHGLSHSEVRKRLHKYGHNSLTETKRKSIISILMDQFRSLMIVLLLMAAAVSLFFQEYVEGIAIAAVIAINTAIGFLTEMSAVRSMEALQRMTKVSTKARRNGTVKEIPADQLVPGDIVVLEGGDIVSADLRVIQASKLQADESALTGESVPVGKHRETVDADSVLADRKNMLFKGTAVTRGSGEGVAVSTGMATELGHISALVEEAVQEQTPLEKRLHQLGRNLIWLTLAIAIFVAISGIFAGKEMVLMVKTAIALAVAAVPEGLPIVATIALARGMFRMARRNAIINQLSAVESLGSTNVIFTDKTGTLTENKMTVMKYALSSGEITVGSEEEEAKFRRNGQPIDPKADDILRNALEIGVLCNNAALPEPGSKEQASVGDPLEVALLIAGAKAGINQRELTAAQPEAREEAFDSDTKLMGTFNKLSEGFRVAVKGAPEAVLSACSSIRTPEGMKEMTEQVRREWLERNEKMAQEGLRILALETKTIASTGEPPYKDLTLVGLVGLLDPPRSQVRDSIALCHKAGIRVIMVTGDQPVTARSVGASVGLGADGEAEVIQGKHLRDPEQLSEEDRRRLIEANIFARVSPKQKLDLITLHQKSKSIVAMTGDGVNDAPALKKADIGVAMGLRGTQVAREAADMVLKDDAFSTIVAAIEQGRVIFNNIRKFIVYLLSCNVSEILIVSLASIVRAPLPLLPLQILFLNLVTDVFPALALGVGEGDPEIMKRPPRDPKESLITRRHWGAISIYGALITVAVLTAFGLAFVWLDADYKLAVTVSFVTLALAQLWHVFNMRDRDTVPFRNEITRNRYVWGALILCVGLLLLAVYLPILALVLNLTDPGQKGWALIVGMSLVPLVIGQLFNRFFP